MIASHFVAFERGKRYEEIEHGLEVGDRVSVSLDNGRRRVRGRITGFSSYEGSGLVFTNADVHIEGLEWPVGYTQVVKEAQ